MQADASQDSQQKPSVILTALCAITQALGVVFLQLGIDPRVITNSTSSCQALRNLNVEFDLSSYSTLTPAQVSVIATKNSTVVGVSMREVGPEELHELVPHIQLLRKLELSYSDNLTDFSFIEQLPCLAELFLQGTIGLTRLPRCQMLHTLNLWGCTKLEDIASLGECEMLCALDLSDCKQLRHLEPLAGCRRLQQLSVANNIMVIYCMHYRAR